MIRLVTFDALHTLLTFRLPVYVQYAQTFEPYLGHLDPVHIKSSFKAALKAVQKEKPAYAGGSTPFWDEVIRRTAIGAGADADAVHRSLPEITPKLMHRFSSDEGYKAFEDALPVLKYLNEELQIRTALISNADGRMRSVLESLGAVRYLSPILLSEEAGIEKPDQRIFSRALKSINDAPPPSNETMPIAPEECLHVGDELICDYHGALSSSFNALLLRRLGELGEGENKEPGEDLYGVNVIQDLWGVVTTVKALNLGERST